MIDHQDVRGLGSHAHFIERAGTTGAGQADFTFTAFIFSRETRPDIAFSWPVEVDLSAVAGAALVHPDQYLGQHA